MVSGFQRRMSVQDAADYTSASQIARVLTEKWVSQQVACPLCGSTLKALAKNTPGRDFCCVKCAASYQPKSYKGKRKPKLIGAEYRTTVSILLAAGGPHLLVVRYSKEYMVQEVFWVENKDITKDHVQPRRPLSSTARRAGWQGSTLLLGQMPFNILLCEPLGGAA